MQAVGYRELTQLQLDEIKPLWEELNKIHLGDSAFFKDHYATFTFEKRIGRWKYMPENDIHVLVAETEKNIAVCYCVSVIKEDLSGEIDSLFLQSDFRGNGIGKTLMEKSMEWLKNKNCHTIRLGVSYGHESVLEFYRHLDFYPRITLLEWKGTK